MQAHKTLVAVLLAMALTGCNLAQPDPEATAYIERERAYAERAAELEYLERQAGVYSACTWLVDVCPTSLTTKGREAIERGYVGGGGSSSLFWFLALIKFLVLGVGLGALLATPMLFTRWVMAHKIAPTREASSAARQAVETAKQEANEVLTEAHKKVDNMTQEVHDRQQQLHAQVKKLEARVKHLNADIETLETQKTLSKEEAERLNLLALAARGFD